MKRWIGYTLAFALALAALFWWLGPRTVHEAPPVGERIVSLAPAITETLFAIGAAQKVVGVSDYCDYPPEVKKLARLGTSITPNYEGIARIHPTLIVSEQGASARKRELSELGRTELLPWLSLEEIVDSTEKLGRLAGQESEAAALAARLKQRLSVPEPAGGPRVLLVLSYQPGKIDEVWFIRRNSLHGAMLRAAGGRNAVQEDITGLPRMSLSRLIELDPEIIVILPPPALAESQRAKLVSDWKALEPLSAPKHGRVVLLDVPDALSNGPRVLELTDRLAELLQSLTAK